MSTSLSSFVMSSSLGMKLYGATIGASFVYGLLTCKNEIASTVQWNAGPIREFKGNIARLVYIGQCTTMGMLSPIIIPFVGFCYLTGNYKTTTTRIVFNGPLAKTDSDDHPPSGDVLLSGSYDNRKKE